ncbi:MAG TPA: glycogen debranching protein GlgX [Minicystis sp.]|nr:glycogen debranching protein GlgX [Minicystis sp.]
MTAIIWPGKPYPLGASFDGMGVNFAVFSENATGIDVCLFDRADDRAERERIALPERTAHVYHGYVPGLKPGQLYGLRAHGAWDPKNGHRFNPAKLLVDPYAQAIANEVDWRAPMFPYRVDAPDGDLLIDDRDNAWGAPKSVVVANVFDWENDRHPLTPWSDTVIYEAHVKGFTARHPDVPERLRGTYAGIATDPVIQHLKRLGVTALELLPVHEKVNDKALMDRGLINYWGYNTLAYFAVEGEYASLGRLGEQVSEFKQMVKTLHEAGIEVILDVVYNHTAEGDHRGAMLSLKGLDNRAYYRVVAKDPRFYMDYTGCGNTLNMQHPQTLKLIMDSLRYWVTEMHVDGFRFDLASTLARELHDVDRLSAFFDIIHQDPILSRTKLIAEPWDVGEGGYQVGNFPVLWAEWNGRYRDAVRRFWKGDSVIAEIGYRLTGSSDLYELGGRGPSASINFVTAHDGFTLEDLVSYEKKHNEENGEHNRDGSDANDSSNHGVEGPTNDPAIVELRERQKRNLLATLLLSQGVPMMCGGDEFGRTQRGNNNAYCQDNPTSWLDWELDDRRRAELEFTRRLGMLRAAQPVLRRKHFFSGGRVRNSELKDIVWFRTDGREMTADDWSNPLTRTIGMLLNGDAIPSLDRMGEPIVGDTLLALVHGGDVDVAFVLPAVEWGDAWEVVIDTRTAAETPGSLPSAPGAAYKLVPRSVVVLRLVTRG